MSQGRTLPSSAARPAVAIAVLSTRRDTERPTIGARSSSPCALLSASTPRNAPSCALASVPSTPLALPLLSSLACHRFYHVARLCARAREMGKFGSCLTRHHSPRHPKHSFSCELHKPPSISAPAGRPPHRKFSWENFPWYGTSWVGDIPRGKKCTACRLTGVSPSPTLQDRAVNNV